MARCVGPWKVIIKSVTPGDVSRSSCTENIGLFGLIHIKESNKCDWYKSSSLHLKYNWSFEL